LWVSGQAQNLSLHINYMDLYQEEILEHYHNPQNSGKLNNPTHAHCANNPTCGDKICITINVSDGIIKDIKFEGEGCAISQASTSMITNEIKNKTTDEVLAMTKNDIINTLGIEVGLGRIKCALLGLETIQKALGFEKIEK